MPPLAIFHTCTHTHARRSIDTHRLLEKIHLFINTCAQKTNAFNCLFTNRKEARQLRGKETFWGHILSGLVTFRDVKKTQSAVSGGVLLLFSISSALSQRKGKEENYGECGVRKQSAAGVRVLIEGQSLRVSMEKDPRPQGQGQTGFRNQELESDTPTLPPGRLMTPASLSSD